MVKVQKFVRTFFVYNSNAEGLQKNEPYNFKKELIKTKFRFFAIIFQTKVIFLIFDSILVFTDLTCRSHEVRTKILRLFG